jgi:hypothetical protein
MSTSTKTGHEQHALPRLAYRLAEVVQLTGVSLRSLQRELSAGRLPKPDIVIGKKVKLWHHETVERFLRGPSK